MTHDRRPIITVGLSPLRVEDVVLLARGRARAALDDDPEFRSRIDRSHGRLMARLAAGERVYGVTTGFGESCLNEVAPADVADLPHNLVRFHGCGTGALLTPDESAAVVTVRLASLAAGWSAVRLEVLERLLDLINHRVLPQVPSEGSVGASGDLTPLSYIAAVLIGEREVVYRGETMPTLTAFREAGLTPLRLAPKEGLALMNGTSVMTALVCLAFDRARRLGRLACAVTAMASEGLRGNPAHFDDRLFLAKPHPGQRLAARWIREDLALDPTVDREGRIQDRYSIRCAPHVIGVLLDALLWMRPWVETELNSANDNPLLDPEDGAVLHGGNFYGGHPCFVADSLKNVVANVADLLDRQLALLCSPETSNGLPGNLVMRTGSDRHAHHGFKAMQISASALAAEALKLTMPASVFSRSTECHNQDKVSMGTIAARDALRVLDLVETVAAINVLAVCQVADLRGVEGCSERMRRVYEAVRERVPANDGDRRQDRDITAVRRMITAGTLPIGDTDLAVNGER
ncbi:MAG: aromatic amino acid lyase [Myxococcales bacterium FL481]|nr:MAG: aromatic amino acid lyase [Myxococcales bacterium FL481]